MADQPPHPQTSVAGRRSMKDVSTPQDAAHAMVAEFRALMSAWLHAVWRHAQVDPAMLAQLLGVTVDDALAIAGLSAAHLAELADRWPLLVPDPRCLSACVALAKTIQRSSVSPQDAYRKDLVTLTNVVRWQTVKK